MSTFNSLSMAAEMAEEHDLTIEHMTNSTSVTMLVGGTETSIRVGDTLRVAIKADPYMPGGRRAVLARRVGVDARVVAVHTDKRRFTADMIADGVAPVIRVELEVQS